MADKYYSTGSGKVFVAPYVNGAQAGGFEWIGDCSGFTVTSAEQTQEFRESYTGLNTRVIYDLTSSDLGFTIDIRNIDGANLARAFYGSNTASAGATVSSEAINAYAGKMVPLKNPGVSSVVVTKTAGSVSLVAGTDYTLDAVNGTLTFLPGSTNVTGSSAVPCTVNYTYAAYAARVEALTGTRTEFVFRFEGRSQFDKKPQIGMFYRAKPGLPAALNLIGQDVATLTLTGALLPDDSQASGSKFFSYTQV